MKLWLSSGVRGSGCSRRTSDLNCECFRVLVAFDFYLIIIVSYHNFTMCSDLTETSSNEILG
jgi:hypothetical protein